MWMVIILIAGCMLLCWMSYEARMHQVNKREIKLENLPSAFDGSRIFFISDIHRRELSAEKLQEWKGLVDWVIVGGDIMERNVPLRRVDDNIGVLSSLAPVYAVYGNHDYKADPVGLEHILNHHGVTLLKDENVNLELGGEHICLTGVDYPHLKRNDYNPLPPIQEDVKDVCRIVLVHDPMWITCYPELPAELILAGHTHGGQITMPFFGPIRLNGFYRKYASGMFSWNQPKANVQHPQMLISRGFGTRRIPFRLCCPAEMHVLTLKSR
ncbi:metallophosphoesterase [Paenibacillus pini]|uniref:Phosphoesterase n=1 Tax=Paenibacillus pini JCM 16418 TaxID=1236976 RepID=W7Z3F6_9BACL|nr:metallophosphoesterase [Paenibacillus pini]GAF09024.1 phosphoesterase [Paenibacillus pini JCM 16418]